MPGGDMTRAAPEATTARAGWRSRRWWLPALVGGGVVAALLVAWVVHTAGTRAQPPASALPLRPVGEVALPGDGSRFDYASLDAQRGLLFVAHLGASEVIEVDVRAHRVVRSIANIDQVHGVFVVPDLHRVYATATGANTMIILNEDTGEQIGHAPTGAYPDGLAYDPRRGAIWTTNETGGSETVLDAATGAVRGTVALGADVGNVVYDPTADQMLVAVQGTNQLAVIDPTTLAVAKTLALPGCEHPHGLALDPSDRLGFVACDGNAALLTVDLGSGQVAGTNAVGDGPDVLAYDPGARRLYVAAESGRVSILDLHGRQLAAVGNDHLAAGAHVVAVDPATHHSFYPIPSGADGRPALREFAAAP
jgi:DNA-binding beta-propeller fold protein YncE